MAFQLVTVWFFAAMVGLFGVSGALSYRDQDDKSGLAKWHYRWLVALLSMLIIALLFDRWGPK